MLAEAPSSARCGLDTIEISRMEKFLALTPPEQLAQIFTETELSDAGEGPRRLESLAARFAAKEACCKVFPKETALGTLQPHDFSVRRNAYGAPEVELTANARAVLDRHRIATLRISLTHTAVSASAVAMAEPRTLDVPWFGQWLYHLFPYRRGVVLGNLRRVFGGVVPETEIIRIAQAYYGHYVRFLIELVKLPLMSAARRRKFIRVENMESPIEAHKQGKGLILLTGHFGNWEVSTVAGISQFPQFKGLFHFVRRPLKPELLNQLVTRRFRRAGFGTIAKRGSLDKILDLLASGAVVVYVFDQHAGGKDGVVVDFFGHPAGTFKSPALIAMASGAPVIPATSWREPDGTHVLRFEDPIPLVDCENTGEAIRQNTRAFNAALERLLLRHPEQWIWMHKRWKIKG
jgi:KDO2-lipid IV(A) lauroyltransferase